MRASRSRSALLIASGAFAVHQVRFLLAYGGGSRHRLAAEGHAYLTPLLVLAALGVALGAVRFAARLGRPGEPAARLPRPPLRRAWARSSAWLVCLYFVQESLEGLLVPGHPGGAGAAFGGGGWIAIPLSAAIGLAIALALRGADAAVELVAFEAARPRTAAHEELQPRRPVPPARVSRAGLARHLAGRGPPLASV